LVDEMDFESRIIKGGKEKKREDELLMIIYINKDLLLLMRQCTIST